MNDLKPQSVFFRFFAAVMSSWVIGPTGVLYLHFVGWGEDPNLIKVLLAMSAVAPLQLLLNEYLASGSASLQFQVPSWQLWLLSIAAFIAVILSTDGIKFNSRGGLETFTPLAVTASLFFSYATSKRFYQLVINGSIGSLQACLIGLVPGVTTLLCYVLSVATENPSLINFSAIFPAVAQALYVYKMMPEPEESNRDWIPRTNLWDVGILAAALSVIGWASAALRDMFASMVPGYGALSIVALNLVGTGVMVAARTSYLTSKRINYKSYMYGVGLATLSALATFSISAGLSAVLFLCAMQLTVVGLIALARSKNLSHRYD